MGSKERRERERARIRLHILDAARDMFVRNGYEATTMRAIAQRIDYTATALYHHFHNKEALLSELCAADFRSLAHSFQRIGRVEDPLERLRRIGDAYVQFATEHPMHYQLMFMTQRPIPLDRSIVQGDPGEDAYAFLRSTCAEAIEKGRVRADLTDADQLAQMMWASVHGLVSLHIVKRDDPWVEWRDVRETAQAMCDAMLRGIERSVVAGEAARGRASTGRARQRARVE
jgi:AcrR family transcriptional regulator